PEPAHPLEPGPLRAGARGRGEARGLRRARTPQRHARPRPIRSGPLLDTLGRTWNRRIAAPPRSLLRAPERQAPARADRAAGGDSLGSGTRQRSPLRPPERAPAFLSDAGGSPLGPEPGGEVDLLVVRGHMDPGELDLPVARGRCAVE